jgi:hypothetical protein
MSFSIPSVEPATFRAGETFHWTMSLPDFAPADGWTLTYYFSGPDKFSILATTSGAQYDVLLIATTTAKLTAGRYSYSGIVSKAGELHEARSGVVTLTPNLQVGPAGSQQTANELLLAAVRAKLYTRISTDSLIESYGIHGRQVAKMSTMEMMKLEGILAARVYRERNPGTTAGVPVRVRFGLPS